MKGPCCLCECVPVCGAVGGTTMGGARAESLSLSNANADVKLIISVMEHDRNHLSVAFEDNLNNLPDFRI